LKTVDSKNSDNLSPLQVSLDATLNSQ